VHNLLGMRDPASVELPAGRVIARAVFKPTGPFRGNLGLFYDAVPVGEGTLARTTPVTYGAGGFAVGYQPGPPVTDACPGRFAVPDGLVLQVVIEAQGAPHRDPAAARASRWRSRRSPRSGARPRRGGSRPARRESRAP
jgi:hypothetical protein